MLFSSMIFLWTFLPLVFLGGFFLKTRWENLLLLAASLFFYAWGEPIYVLLMMFSIVVNWLAGLLLGREGINRKLVVTVDVVINLALLGYFKYLGMFAEGINALIRLVAGEAAVLTVPQVVLPIGISFFTFQALSYVVDVYRREVEPQKNILYVALYISFFPQLIAGPIVRYQDVARQIESRQVTLDGLTEGCRRFCYGLGKKVLISNVLAQSVDGIYGLFIGEVTGVMAWVVMFLYTFQIYYDFSGYSDMAIGLGKMFGFDFLENFRYPYMSLSVREFWRRWHISLSTWFREYVYIPLGGNRKGVGRTYLNLGIVFFLTGMWHGASISFILWGLYHGFFSIVERLGLGRFLKKHKALAWVYAFAVVNVGWIFFRVEDVMTALKYVLRLLLPMKYTVSSYSLFEFVSGHTVAVLAAAVLGMGILQRVGERLESKVGKKWRGSIPEMLWCLLLLFLCILSLASNTYNPFIYFKF